MSGRRLPYQRIELEQGTPEWLEFRQGVIGASDAPVIMGENPWKTAKALLREKRGPPSPFRGNAAMRMGTALEPIARQAYQRRRGVRVEPAVLQSTRDTWQAASLDGIDREGSVVVEIKCGVRAYEQLRDTGEVPGYYYGQLQHILCVTTLEEIDFYAYLPGRKGLLRPVERDGSYIERMLEAEERFWRDLTGGREPVVARRRTGLGKTKGARRRGVCPDCSGTGLADDQEICARCGGYGEPGHKKRESRPRPGPALLTVQSGSQTGSTPIDDTTEGPANATTRKSGGWPWWKWWLLLSVLPSALLASRHFM